MKTEKAQIFRNGGSQAVRLPRSVRFSSELKEVNVRKEGDKVVLEPASTWPDTFVKCLGAWRDDIPRLNQSKLSDLVRDDA